MKISLNWVADFVDLPKGLSPADLAHELTLKTVEVEDVIDLGATLDRVVVGVVDSVTPFGDRGQSVAVCRIGKKRTLSAVTAAPNLVTGMSVAVARPGARLSTGSTDSTVDVVTIAGRKSEGVICTPGNVRLQRLFTSSDGAEVLDLSDLNPTVGAPLAKVVGFDDVVLEIDNKSLTNRPDLWGHYGIARELATIYDLPLRPLPTVTRPSHSSSLVGAVDSDLCERLVAVAFDLGGTAGAAPLWMRSRLARIGETSINLCVDFSNYVMFTVGQPTHVYDADKINVPLSVCTAGKQLKLGLLDGSSVDVVPATPVIADAKGAVAIAGIMGGSGAAVGASTRRYLLEAATFRPQPIRRASQRLGLRTEASARFEKALDTPRVDAAIDLFLHLLQELAPASTVTAFQDVTLEETPRRQITVGLEFLATRIGIALDPKEIERVLRSLGFHTDVEGDTLEIAAPSWRSTGDVSLPHDIVEEVARIHGYDKLPTATLNVELGSARSRAARSVDRVVRETLAGRMGMQEVVTYPWVTDAMLTAAGLDKARTVRFDGAPAPDRDSLRPSLVPNLLEAAAANLHYVDDVEIFEVGTVFSGGAAVSYGGRFEPLPSQPTMLAGIMTGTDGGGLFRRAKGVLTQLGRVGHVSVIGFASAETAAWADASARLAVTADGTVVGTLGLLTKRARRLAALDGVQVACFELDLSGIAPRTSRDNSFEALAELPEADFDLSVVTADTVPWTVIAAVAKDADQLVHRVVYVDEFRGAWVPSGHRSVTLRVTLRPTDTTLTTDAISASREAVIGELAKQADAHLRT